VAVLDAGGHLVVRDREDGSGILRPQIAGATGWSALGTGSRCGPPTDGRLLGGVGVSGDVSDVDEACALAGVAARGLRCDAAAPEGTSPPPGSAGR
jgi:uncharacterized protein GlcG (DUF336 family)